MSKSNIRSFRYSDKVADVLANYPSNGSLNDKFESLVLFCFDTVERRKLELDLVNKQIEAKRKEYSEVCKQLQDVSSLMQTLQTLQRYGDLAVKQAESVFKKKV